MNPMGMSKWPSMPPGIRFTHLIQFVQHETDVTHMSCRAAVETLRFGIGEMTLQNVTFARSQNAENITRAESLVLPSDVGRQEAQTSVGW